MFRTIDLFAGTGAFSLALESTGRVTTVWANDMCPNSKKIYDANHDAVKLTQKDLTTIDTVTEIPAHDILTGGFPCQPFSIAGQQAGFQDSRANVFWKIIEILTHHKPRVIILENVKNLEKHNSGRTFTTIKTALEGVGYTIKYKVLDTAKVTSIPQHRERIFIVGFLDAGKASQFNFDFDPVPNKIAPHTLLEPGIIPAKYYYSASQKVWSLVQESVTENITELPSIYQYRRVYVRKNMTGVCPTLTANMGSGGHNVPIIKDNMGIRKLTPRECFNFQGFPATYIIPSSQDKKISDAGLYKLAGNAVSYPVVKLIVDKIIQLMA